MGHKSWPLYQHLNHHRIAKCIIYFEGLLARFDSFSAEIKWKWDLGKTTKKKNVTFKQDNIRYINSKQVSILWLEILLRDKNDKIFSSLVLSISTFWMKPNAMWTCIYSVWNHRVFKRVHNIYCQWPVGLVVWFSLRVREVPGSTPGLALLLVFTFVCTSFRGSPSFLTTAVSGLRSSEPICPNLFNNSFSTT